MRFGAEGLCDGEGGFNLKRPSKRNHIFFAIDHHYGNLDETRLTRTQFGMGICTSNLRTIETLARPVTFPV